MSKFKPPPTKAWPDPQILHGELRPVKKLDPQILPAQLRPWVEDVARRMPCPIDFVAAPAVCALSSVIGAGCSIRPKKLDDWAVIPNLWGGVIARPGQKKSPAIEAAFKPLRRLEKKAAEDYAASQAAHEADKAAFEAQKKAIIAKMEKDARNGGAGINALKRELAALSSIAPPICRRFMTNDTTIEKAGEIIRDNPRGIAIMRDELVGLLAQWDRDDRREDRAFHLTAWNGYGNYTSDRIQRGTIVSLYLCEVIFGGIQPSKFMGFLVLARNNIENDGTLQRFQVLVFPDEIKGGLVDAAPDIPARERAFAIFDELAKMDFVACGAETDDHAKIPYFHFDAEAQQFFNAWYEATERKRNIEGEAIMVEHLAKFDSLMPSLALIFHLVEVADWTASLKREPRPPQSVSLRCAKLAAAWCDYLESHARRIYGLAANAALQGGRKLLEKIESGEIKDGFSARDVYIRNWSFLDSKEHAQAAINELLETHWIREIAAAPAPRAASGGRPLATCYMIHPKALDILRARPLDEEVL